MLQIKDIHKQYITGDLVQTALDGVSLNLRDNEFVAILGPSGSGKTTMLNVIGGLDRYDSGDLIINGISTKKYSDRDWDSYRNHTIGFVFQSYNLIPHQTVLANVELALTISGISPSERRRRAARALEDVGLGNQLHKKPNQMSGGQMQRVAIARALVNNPDILLADEPTGALDSDTSVQVMELLKAVSKDRLVVMVTHNPELAEAYANRIVRVRDGKIIDDTNPFEPDLSAMEPPSHRDMGHSSMSFLTALSLSFNNLRTKFARTLLTSFAGSIGIIGIALILSLSTGFQKYVDKIQEDTLSNYPLVLQSETANMGAFMTAYGANYAQSQELPDGIVAEQPMIGQMFSQIGKNDLKSFKSYLEENFDQVKDNVTSVRYSYGIKPRIYSADPDKVLQVNPATLFGDITGMSAMSAYMDSDIFYEMVDNIPLLSTQYQLLGGRWPESYNEMVLVLSDPHRLSDYAAYSLGLKDSTELQKTIALVMSGQDFETSEDAGVSMQWSYEELLSLRFRLVAASDLYRYNAEYNVWEDMSDDQSYMRKLIDNGEELQIVGLVCPMDGNSSTLLQPGIGYTSALTEHVIEQAKDSPIVASQLANPDVDVFTGTEFYNNTQETKLNFENMISVDADALSSAFGMNVDQQYVVSLLQLYLTEALDGLSPTISPSKDAFVAAFREMGIEMMQQYISENADPATGKAALSVGQVSSLAEEYLASPEATEKIRALSKDTSLSEEDFRQVLRPLLSGFASSCIASALPQTPDIPDIPDVTLPSIPTHPEETTPTHPEETTPAQPEETTPAQPEETEPATEPLPSETTPETAPAATTETTPVTEPTQPPADVPESQPSATEPVTTESAAASPAVVFDSAGQDSGVRLVLLGDSTEPTVPPAINAVKAQIDMQTVNSCMETYASSSLVTGTASAMAVQMSQSNIEKQLTAKVEQFGYSLMGYLGSTMQVDESKIASAFQFNMNEEELRRLMSTMSATEKERSAGSNLRSLGYADYDEPTSISIYMTDFTGKEEFLTFLNGYNEQMEAEGKEDQVISYTDMTGMLMSSVRTIIDSVSYVLIAFVSVSLVVSSIMIGIITYISVMERTKEIGILRAIGASKHNISQVFNAETFIIGLCSGILGVGITLSLNYPINLIIHNLTGSSDINSQLPIAGAGILILLSMILTLIGGLIPASKAAKKDPVIALRSE